MSDVTLLILLGAVMLCTLGGVTLLAHIYDLNHIKSKTVGDGQHGTARWATKAEIKETYAQIPFTSEKWRSQAKQGNAPTMSLPTKKRRLFRKTGEVTEQPLPQGIVAGCRGGKVNTMALVDTGDVHALMIGAAGRGQNRVLVVPMHRVRLRERDELSLYRYKGRRHEKLRHRSQTIRLQRIGNRPQKPDSLQRQ